MSTAADALAIGDGRNDLEMFEWAGRGVAMGQAIEVVTTAADDVTGSVYEDGLAAELTAGSRRDASPFTLHRPAVALGGRGRRPGSWHFVTSPPSTASRSASCDPAARLRLRAVRAGGRTAWQTSVFPDSKSVATSCR